LQHLDAVATGLKQQAYAKLMIMIIIIPASSINLGASTISVGFPK